MVLEKLAYLSLFGKPLIFYLGIVSLTSLLATVLLAVLIRRNKLSLSFKWHIRMAWVTVGVSLLHGLLALSVYL